MLKTVLLVGAGSFLGGVARYLVSLALRGVSSQMPWATFAVNILGCLLIGILWALSERLPGDNNHLMLFLSVGLCGGFTTFSTFSKEGLAMLQSGNTGLFLLYAVGSVVLGICAVALGYHLLRQML